MPLKRILEIARRNGIPLIVTDQDGAEPMVVLSLEQFEAMSAVPIKQVVESHVQNDENYSEPVFQSFTPSQISPDLLMKNPIKTGEQAPDEEGFFLEPLDDGIN